MVAVEQLTAERRMKDVPRTLTAEEYQSVQLATRGESYAHRRWPQEVVRAVAAADVVITGEARRAANPLQALGSRLRAWRGRRRGHGELATA